MDNIVALHVSYLLDLNDEPNKGNISEVFLRFIGTSVNLNLLHLVSNTIEACNFLGILASMRKCTCRSRFSSQQK